MLGLDSDAGDLGTGDRKKEHFSPQRQRMERHIGRNAPSGVWGRTLSGKGNSGGFFIFISTIWCVFHAAATGFVLPRSAMRRMEYGWTPCSGPISRLQKTVLRKIWPIRRLPIHWQYRVDGRTEKEPKVPKPYETYSEADRY